MGSLRLTAFLLIFVVQGAQGATPALDAACDPDPSVDTCTDTAANPVELACDTLADPDVCKIKVDQACSADKCVTGAACDTASSNQCKCGAGYTATDAKICAEITANTFGGACTGGPADKGSCTDANALCSAASGYCACKTGYTGTDGAGCKRDLGGACTINSDCADANAECDAFAKTCLLKTDQTCTTKQDKCVSGASCDTTLTPNQCKCIAGVYTDTSNLCYATTAGKVTGDCKGTAPKCDDTNADCDTTSTRCKCNTGYKLKNADATCEKSGAITVIASALTVMLVSVSGHLIMLH